MQNKTKSEYSGNMKIILLSILINAFVLSAVFGEALPRAVWKQKHDDAVTAAFFIHGNKEIVYSAYSVGKYDRNFGNISIRKTADGELVNTQISFYPFSDDIVPIALHPGGKMVATGHQEERGSCLTFYDLATLNRNGKAGCNSTFKVSHPAFSPDGKTIATISAQSMIKFYDTSSREIIAMLARNKKLELITSIAFSPDKKTIASAHLDNSVVIWDIAGGKELKTFQEHASPVTFVTFSPDGKTIASGHLDNSIVLWEVASGKQLKTFQEHTAPVTSLAFTPNGKYLASGSKDNTIKLWDLQAQKSLATLEGHTQPVLCLSPSSDSKRLVSGGADGNLILWQIR